MTQLQKRFLFYVGIYCGALMVIAILCLDQEDRPIVRAVVCFIFFVVASAPLFLPLVIPGRFTLLYRITRWVCALLLLLHVQSFVHMVPTNINNILGGDVVFMGPLIVAIMGILACIASMWVLFWPDMKSILVTNRPGGPRR